jgi:hypothetical protein
MPELMLLPFTAYGVYRYVRWAWRFIRSAWPLLFHVKL